MHRVPLIVSLALIPCAAAAQAKTTTKIESQLLVTGETGMQFSVSPHGGHLAAVTQKGSRWLVIFDGTAGPLFDEIAMPSGGGDKVTWSPDGSRYAYVGRVGEQYSVMVDGKEQLKVPATNETGVAQIQGKGRTNITFTPDSKHIFYGIQTVGPGPGGAKFMQNQIVYDGVVEPPDQGDGQTMVYGAEGPHHAYLIMARASTALNHSGQNKTLLVVDGKLAPYTAGTLQYTADGTHLFSQVVSNVPGKGSAFQLLVDGHPVMRAQGIRVYMAPVGDGFVAVVSQQGPGGTPNQFLVHGATRVAGSDCGGFGYDSGVLFSADGKHYAAPCKTTAASVAMVIDGKKGREYQNITEFAFSPDGTHSMYKATSGKTFVVTGEAESDGYQILDSLRFGGAHTGFIATKASGSAPWEVVIDGKPVPRTDTQVASLFRMSADGAHWAYLTGYGNAVGLVLDGTDQGLSMVNGFERSFRGKRFVFSPDGKHFATFGTPKAMPDATGILFDSKFLKLGVQYVFHPTFTPDGRHFLFLTEDPGNAKESIYVDGKVVAQVDANTSLADNPAAWEMGADGVLTLVAQDAGAIKRFRLTPGSDASIETLLALAKKP